MDPKKTKPSPFQYLIPPFAWVIFNMWEDIQIYTDKKKKIIIIQENYSYKMPALKKYKCFEQKNETENSKLK